MPSLKKLLERTANHALVGSVLLGQLVFLLPISSPKIVASDFPSFYAAARIWRTGGNPYSLSEQCKAQTAIRSADLPCLPLAHPPILLPLVSEISSDNLVASYWRWLTVLVLISIASLVPLYFLSRNLMLSIESLLFLPLVTGVLLGQDVPLILFGALMWAYLLLTGRDFASGLALSLSVIKPHIAILLALPLLFSRRTAFLGFCAGALALTVFSFALVGLSGFRGLLEIAQIMSKGEGFGIYQSKMPNATGLLVSAGLSPFWSWGIFVFGVVAISLLWRQRGLSQSTLGIAVIVALFAVPHTHFHDLCLLLIPLWPLSASYPSALAVASLSLLIGAGLSAEPVVAYCLMLILLWFHARRSARDLRFPAKHDIAIRQTWI